MKNIERYIKEAMPVKNYFLASCISSNSCATCPAKEVCNAKRSLSEGGPIPIECANSFKRWALSEEKKKE